MNIRNRIYEFRGERVMLDRDLAVKRNIARFPADFMFQLTIEEWNILKKQVENLSLSMSSQFVMTSIRKRPNYSVPYVFTEQGIAMLSGILKSQQAISMNIAIMRTFVEIRKVLGRSN